MEAVAECFAQNFTLRGEIGASVSVWRGEVEILSLHHGARTKDEVATWHVDTPVPVWSAGKGPAALAFLLALHGAGLTLETPVQHVWPELRAMMNFGRMLSHRGGLAALDSPPSVFDHAAVAAALAQQAPLWPPGDGHGYHPRTWGFLLEECARRLTGQGIGELLRETITGPLGAEFWIGLPHAEHHRVARLYPGKPRLCGAEDPEAAFFAAFGTPDSLTRRAFSSPAGLHAVSDMNQPAAWSAGLAAFGATGTAGGLAKIYALLAAGGCWQGRRLVPEEVMRWLGTRLCQGHDRVLLMPSAFSAGCMMDVLDDGGGKVTRRFGPSAQAFGHPGAGGSLGFADPENGVAFAYVMNQMEQGVMPNAKTRGLVEALYASL
jgi:CubicO group peptidase (beta-lactamase class C family)